MQNVIFLDIDGVLNSAETEERYDAYTGVADQHIERLKRIVEETDAVLILSSSWKQEWVKTKRLKEKYEYSAGRYLDERLWKFGLTISGKTSDRGYNRGYGIRKWLDKHEHGSWIVLDDEVFADYKVCGIMERLVKTETYIRGGLRDPHVEIAVKLMATEPVEGEYKSLCTKALYDRHMDHFGRAIV